MKKMDLRVIKTKEVLKEALMQLLKEKNLNSISVTEICRIAKVNRGTFYSHYGQVENLFEEYFRDIMKDLADSYQEPYRYVQTLQANKLNPATIRIFHHIEKYEKFYRIVFSKTVPLSYYYLLLYFLSTEEIWDTSWAFYSIGFIAILSLLIGLILLLINKVKSSK